MPTMTGSTAELFGWGESPTAGPLAPIVGQPALSFEQAAGTVEECRLRLTMRTELLPECCTGHSIDLPFPFVRRDCLEGDILAQFSDGKETWPAVTIKDGTLRCNFPIDRTVAALLTESEVDPPSVIQRLITGLPHYYQLVPPTLRARVLAFLVSQRRRNDDPCSFPRWPGDDTADLLRYFLLGCLGLTSPGSASVEPFWPNGKKYALILTHDMDTTWCLKVRNDLANIEENLSLRSVWFVVCRNLEEPGVADRLARLAESGHEIGCHGWEHRPGIASFPAERLDSSLSKCASALSLFGPDLGFRSPFLARGRSLYEALPKYFLYDASAPDSERYVSSSPNGCATVFPFCRSGLVQLPLTMPQDALLLTMGYGYDDVLQLWSRKLAWVKERGGLVTISTHPEPHFGASPVILKAYAGLLEAVVRDDEAWLATPREVARWWLARSAGAAAAS
jgi:peptidoglycan/xylan/chitin deacetylase (PgdA/CDA1 family)